MDGASLAEFSPSAAETQEEEVFLTDIRAFLDLALTTDLREAGRRTLGVHAEVGACRLWHRRLYERGWIAPAWPAAWGGTGWTPRQRFLFDRELSRNDAPILFATGLRSLGPLLIEMGSPAQRARYLPAILSGAELWCQGFSEPGAGSDLAAVSTRAVRDGDDYVINGAKIWTTGAHFCDQMFAIFRTSDGPKRQQGLTFLLVDMKTPGVTVTPIIELSGEHEFNHVYFDNARVPAANRIGAEDDGWSVAKRLMELARSNNTPAALVARVLLRTTAALLAAEDQDEVEPALRRRLAGLWIELEAFERLEFAALGSGRPRQGDIGGTSMLKLIGSELHQKVAELAFDIAGPRALATLDAIGLAGDDIDAGARAVAKHFAVRAATIYSGSSETQRNVIGKALLATR